MNRRGFLTALAGAVGAMTLDPERLLWRPGAKLISIPAQRRCGLLTTDEIVRETLRILSNNLVAVREYNRRGRFEFAGFTGQKKIGDTVFIRIPSDFRQPADDLLPVTLLPAAS